MNQFTLQGVDVAKLRLTPHIQTASGYYINFLDFTNNSYSIFDIAHHLSHLCRFVGATRCFYSVAQHSVWCSHKVPQHLALLALMHDSHEAYVGDCATPLKQLLPNFQMIENALQADMFRAYGLDSSDYARVKKADYMALKREQFYMMPGFEVEGEVKTFLENESIVPVNHAEARKMFLERYVELGGELNREHYTTYMGQLQRQIGSVQLIDGKKQTTTIAGGVYAQGATHV